MKTKLLTIGLAFLLLCSVWPPALFAAEEPEFYMTVSKAEAAVGEPIEVEIGVRGAQEVVAFELNLTFEPSLWTAASDAFATGLTGFSAVVNTELLGEGHVRAVYTKLGDAAGDSGNVVLGKVKLTAKAAGTGAFTLTSVKVGDAGDQWTSYTPGIQASARAVGSGSGGGGGDGAGGGDSGTDTGNEPIITETSVLVKAVSSGSGAGQVRLNAAHMQKAVELMKGAALNLVLQPEASARSVELEFPLAQVRNAGEKVAAIVIDSGLARIALDRKLFAAGDAANAANLQLTVALAESSALPPETRELLQPGAVVYDFELKLDGRPVAAFGKGEVTVEIPYTLRPGETADKIIVYYVSDSGGLEPVKNARYNPATGMVRFSPRHFSSYFPAYVHKTFGDLGEAEWARAYIEALAARDAVNGVGGDRFQPNGQLTRAQFITMLVQLFELEDATAVATFIDTKEGTWYYAAVASAQKLGIVQGKPDGSFGAGDPISRQDMAVMLYRASKAMGLQWSSSSEAPTFADRDRIAPYAAEAVAVMQEQGIINGMGDNSFAPHGLSTRAQAAAVLYRMFGL